MRDLISRQAAIDALEKIPVREFKKTDGLLDALISIGQVYRALKQLPSVQPEVIRCKDCKHSEHWYRDKSRCFLWHEEGIDVFEDGFCSYAERRADGRD